MKILSFKDLFEESEQNSKEKKDKLDEKMEEAGIDIEEARYKDFKKVIERMETMANEETIKKRIFTISRMLEKRVREEGHVEGHEIATVVFFLLSMLERENLIKIIK